MKKTIINLLIITVIILCGATSNTFSQIREHSFRKLKNSGIIQRDTAHQNQLKAFFEIDSVQHASADGIKFSIKFKNTGMDIDSILNFTSLFRIKLLNSSEKNIFYRDRPPFGAYKSSTSFVIDAVKVNDKKVDVILDDINVSPASPVYTVIPLRELMRFFVE